MAGTTEYSKMNKFKEGKKGKRIVYRLSFFHIIILYRHANSVHFLKTASI